MSRRTGPAGVGPSDCRDSCGQPSTAREPTAMTHMFTLARLAARFRALLLVALAPAFGACDADRLANSSEDPLTVTPAEPAGAPTTVSFSSSFRGGIPLGTFAQP